MVAPLSLHFVVGSFFAWPHAGDYDAWIFLSVLLVGHAHVALCVCAVLWARGVCRRQTATLGDGLQGSMLKTLLIATGVASAPGALFLGVPPLLVLVTGVVFVPAMYAATVRCTDTWGRSLRKVFAHVARLSRSGSPGRRRARGHLTSNGKTAPSGNW
jgi:hypothetical protein